MSIGIRPRCLLPRRVLDAAAGSRDMKRYDIRALPSLCVLLVATLAGCSKPPPEPPPPPPPPPSENVREFSIGGMKGIALLDGGLEVPNNNEVLGVGRTPEEV